MVDMTHEVRIKVAAIVVTLFLAAMSIAGALMHSGSSAITQQAPSAAHSQQTTSAPVSRSTTFYESND